MGDVLYRVDAGPRGLGHLQRCLSLAEALRRHSLESVFLASPFEGVQERVERAGCRFAALDLRSGDAGTDRDWLPPPREAAPHS